MSVVTALSAGIALYFALGRLLGSPTGPWQVLGVAWSRQKALHYFVIFAVVVGVWGDLVANIALYFCIPLSRAWNLLFYNTMKALVNVIFNY